MLSTVAASPRAWLLPVLHCDVFTRLVEPLKALRALDHLAA